MSDIPIHRIGRDQVKLVRYSDHIADKQKDADKLLDCYKEIEKLQASNNRKRAKIKAMESSDYDRRIKAKGVNEALEAYRQHELDTFPSEGNRKTKQYALHWIYTFANKLEEDDD